MSNNNKHNNNNNVDVKTTFAGLVANNSAFVPKYWFKQVAALLTETDDADAAAIRWHLDTVGLKIWGGACVAYANEEKTAIICRYPEKSNKADKADKADKATPSLFALIDAAAASAAALTAATSERAKNAAQVSALTANVDALTAAVVSINDAAAAKRADEEKKAAARRKVVVDALKYNGLTEEEADALADKCRVVKGVKTAFGHAYKWDAMAASFNYVFRVELDAARAAAANVHAETLDELEAAQRAAAAREANAAALTDVSELFKRCDMYRREHNDAALDAVLDAAINAAGGRVLGRRIVAAADKGVIVTADTAAVGVARIDADTLAALKAALARPYVRPARRRAAAPDLTAPAANDASNAAANE